jgi:hypothetical protein
MISATITEPHSDLTTRGVRRSQSKVRLASVSRIVNLTKDDYSKAAGRFMRWRRKHMKPAKPRIKRIWVR